MRDYTVYKVTTITGYEIVLKFSKSKVFCQLIVLRRKYESY